MRRPTTACCSRILYTFTCSLLVSCATAPDVQTARVLESEQRTIGVGFSQVKYGSEMVDPEILETLPNNVPENIALNLLSISGRIAVAEGIDIGGIYGGPIGTDKSIGASTHGPASADVKFRIADTNGYQSALSLGVGIVQFRSTLPYKSEESGNSGSGMNSGSNAPSDSQSTEVTFNHAETGLYFLNSITFGIIGIHINPAMKFRSTQVAYEGPLKGQQGGRNERVTLYSKRGAIRGGTLGLSLGAAHTMKLLLMAGKYFDSDGQIAESHLTFGIAEIMSERMGSGKSKKSGTDVTFGQRETGSLLVKAGFGGAETALAIPSGESTTLGIALQTYKNNPLKDGGASLSEEAIKNDAGTGGALFSEWFPWTSHGSCYFRAGVGYLKYPDDQKGTFGIDLGFGQRWTISSIAFDLSWLQLMIPTAPVKAPENEDKEQRKLPIRTPAFGVGYAF